MMKQLLLPVVFGLGLCAAQLTGFTTTDPKPIEPQEAPLVNPNIDMNAFVKGAQSAALHRLSRLLSEEDFIKMSKEEGVIILDARSKQKYDLLHIEGAINLSFADIDVESIQKVLPDKNATILIYCNNNFTPAFDVHNTPRAEPVDQRVLAAFPSKSPAMSLNLSTQTTLYNYGYQNVYELGPTVDPNKTKLKLVSNK